MHKISRYRYDMIYRNSTNRDQLQQDLLKLVDWTERWRMQFNVSKCKVMHMGRQNPL